MHEAFHIDLVHVECCIEIWKHENNNWRQIEWRKWSFYYWFLQGNGTESFVLNIHNIVYIS
jgi:hypothetical protein